MSQTKVIYFRAATPWFSPKTLQSSLLLSSSHSSHLIRILLILPLQYNQNPTTSPHLHSYCPGPSHHHPLPGLLQKPPNWSLLLLLPSTSHSPCSTQHQRNPIKDKTDHSTPVLKGLRSFRLSKVLQSPVGLRVLAQDDLSAFPSSPSLLPGSHPHRPPYFSLHVHSMFPAHTSCSAYTERSASSPGTLQFWVPLQRSPHQWGAPWTLHIKQNHLSPPLPTFPGPAQARSALLPALSAVYSLFPCLLPACLSLWKCELRVDGDFEPLLSPQCLEQCWGTVGTKWIFVE